MKFRVKVNAYIEFDDKQDIFQMQDKISRYITKMVELEGINSLDVNTLEFSGDIGNKRISIFE
jgi:hypothetical protein